MSCISRRSEKFLLNQQAANAAAIVFPADVLKFAQA